MNGAAQLIHTLLSTNRQATDKELQQIITAVAQASFSFRPLKINRWLRQELETRGFRVPSEKLPSVEIHLLKRIYLDRQWLPGTSVDQLVADLHQAVQHPDVQVWTTAGSAKRLPGSWHRHTCGTYPTLKHLSSWPIALITG